MVVCLFVCFVAIFPILAYFLKKTLLKRKIVQSGELDFDHHFAFLTNFLKRYNFLLSDILLGSSRGSFSKKKLCKTDLPFRFCKIGLRNTLFL